MAYTVHEASAEILGTIAPLPVLSIPLRDVLGRVLGEDVVSPVDHPPWDNASMDGYAVRGSDVAAASDARPVVLPVLETVRAGGRSSRALAPNTAIRIMTGAPIPDGADTVIRVEDTDGGEHTVAIRDPRDTGRNIRPRGEDMMVGSLVLTRGTSIDPAVMGVLASVGKRDVVVHRRPRVAVLASGDELVDVDGFDAVLRGERIVSSNTYTLVASARAAGADVVELGIVGDDPAAYRERLRGAQGCDLLITSGGVSVGAYDFTKDVLKSLGADLRLWRVKMRPGAPLGFGTLHGMPWLGLPGNPVSAMVTFELFARPLIRKLRGEGRLFRRVIEVQTRERISIAAPLTHFLRAVVEWDGQTAMASLTGPQGSGLLTSMSRANALIVVPAEREVIAEGEKVSALLLDGAFSSDTFLA
ncbi:MAG: gephyrin-like molybdotransferase Glp [Gemmatimonadaceae bacterium]